MKKTERWTMENVRKHTTNVYEAVLVASKRARQLNEERLAKLELMPEDESIDIDTRKVTEIALKELSDGLIKTER
ncbi:MAG: DNA-directed RNA polymerase subunit omega [candidate division Zixibacteria bacterium]|nr:DNA-directed RNA polymerase subunit omega [candidate division Zixibacteria bacterium]MBU1471669.1 DNA-directed RNA polymerase subunit omega [candidate division Zixibacteria bacterium]MBU2625435.1 DNA-directed RNA polymerase subunit omega [candidate division Zixibacteria bacterium]